MKKSAVTIVGSLNYDIIFKQKRLPAVGETFTADSVTVSGGGKGANQAVQCRKLGLTTYLVGKVGSDNFGKELLSNLKRYDLNTDYVSVANTNTGLGVVNSIDSGQVVATISQGANYSLTREDIDQAESIIRKSKIVVLQLEIPMDIVEYVIKLAKKHGCYVILNAAPAVKMDPAYLKMVDCLVVNETEASFYSQQLVTNRKEAEMASETLHESVNDLVIITLGEKGSLFYDGQEKHFFEPKKVDVVETTGAGDSYIGAIAYAYMNCMPYPLMGEFASLVSSRTVMNIGAQESMPTLEEIK